MTAFLAIIGVQLMVAAMLFGTLLLDRAADIEHPNAHPLLRFLRRRAH